jgi:1-deoxy-D-xylulose-5-phosphate reductoisomerase
VAVEAFLDERLAFPGIAAVIEAVLSEIAIGPLESLDHVYAVDVEARALAAQRVRRFAAMAAAPSP